MVSGYHSSSTPPTTSGRTWRCSSCSRWERAHLRPARFREDSLRLPGSERLGRHTLLPRGQEFSEETCESLLLPLRLKFEGRRGSEVGGDERVLFSVRPTATRRPFVG